MPTFIIKDFPNSGSNEIKELLQINAIFIAANSSGWMKEAMFALWCLHFFCQIFNYKLQNHLPPNDKILLILDGHASRSNVLGLVLHTSHISQMFDVLLAAQLKRTFTKHYNYYLNKFEILEGRSKLQKERLAMIHAVRDSWAVLATPGQCEKSGETAGYFKQTPEELEEFLGSEQIARDKLADAYRKKARSPFEKETSNDASFIRIPRCK